MNEGFDQHKQQPEGTKEQIEALNIVNTFLEESIIDPSVGNYAEMALPKVVTILNESNNPDLKEAIIAEIGIQIDVMKGTLNRETIILPDNTEEQEIEDFHQKAIKESISNLVKLRDQINRIII